MHCALCGRSMDQAAVMIGAHPVGPTCARRAGLMDAARKRRGLLSLVAQRKRVDDQQQMSLGLDENQVPDEGETR